MCQREDDRSFRLIPLPRDAADPARPPQTSTGMATASLRLANALSWPPSRRRRLWDLDDHAHCPVIGVCMPIPTLRRLLRKLPDQMIPADDYELHCLVVGASKSRTHLADLIQKDLDQRYQLRITQLGKIKDEAELRQQWRAALQGKDVAATFWALITHGRCSAELERQILGDIHMLQHQVGMAVRADHAQLDALLDENAVLTRELARAQQRSQQLAQDHAAALHRLEQETMRLRGELIARQTELDRVQDQLQSLMAQAPELPARLDLARINRQQLERIHQLQRALLQSEQTVERHQRRAQVAQDALARLQTLPPQALPQAITRLHDSAPEGPQVAQGDVAGVPPEADALTPQALAERAVLCVGGRPNVIPIYRDVIERVGGQFIHHDGGVEENTAKLDATLAAADLVICQTGCVSHDAYWRVKHHCKRTGKQCVFVDTPSKAALERALQALLVRSPDQ